MDNATFTYLQWQESYKTEKPFQILIDLPKDAKDQRRTNVEYRQGREQDIFDVRAISEPFDIDLFGFTHVTHSSSLRDAEFCDRALVEERYLPECEALLRRVLDGVDKVHFFNWLVRDSDSSSRVGKVVDLDDPLAKVGPARVVHIGSSPSLVANSKHHLTQADQTPESAVNRVLTDLPTEAERLLRGRLRLINIWRPINGPLQSWPLALCDGRGVSPSSLVEADRVRRKYTGGTTFVLEEPGTKWYYMSDQGDDEVAVFKNFDSQDGVTKHSAHTSFMQSGQTKDSPPRQSIEARALVFTYEDEAR